MSARHSTAAIKVQLAEGFIADLREAVAGNNPVWARTGKGSFADWARLAQDNLQHPDVQEHLLMRSMVLAEELDDLIKRYAAKQEADHARI